MAIKAAITKNGIELKEGYIRPSYLAINFESGSTVHYEVFPTGEKLGKFPDEALQGIEFTDEELNEIKTVVYNAMKRTDLLNDGIDC